MIGRARSEPVGEAYLAATEKARGLGIFGSPSFMVDGEPFWGDDRLEDRVEWRRRAESGLRITP